MKINRILSVAMAALMLASCSNGERAVRKAAESFLAAYFAMDNDLLEGLCTAELAQAICQRDNEMESLPEHIASKIKEASASTSFNIDSIDADQSGDVMYVSYSVMPYESFGKAIPQKMSLVRQESKWKVASINRTGSAAE